MAHTARKPLWIKIISGLFYSVWVVFAIFTGTLVGWGSKGQVTSEVMKQTLLNTPPEVVFRPTIQDRNALTLLILGTDEDRAPGGKKILRQNARSDMMLLTRLDFKTKRITGISIPRDTLCELPGYRPMKINAYYSIGGKALAKSATEQLVGVNVDKVVEINYKAFQEMVNLIGGVEVFIEKPLKYTDRRGGLFINLKPGRQKLDGYNAMCYVRYRHGDSDYARQNRQKDFLLAVKDRILSQPALINTVADKGLEVLGGDVDAREMAALLLFAKKVGNDNIKMGQIPVLEVANYNLRVDGEKLRKTLQEFHFLDDEPFAVSYQR